MYFEECPVGLVLEPSRQSSQSAIVFKNENRETWARTYSAVRRVVGGEAFKRLSKV